MRIEPRTAWGARPPKSVAKIAPTPRLWLHHSVTGTGPVPGVIKSIQDYHMGSRGWQDIAYSFLATVDGRAWTGRGALVAGGHSATAARPRENFESHAVCAIGDFDATRPPAALIEALAQIAAHGHREGWWTCRGYTGGHRDVPGAATACPGRHLYAQIPAINRRVNEILAGKPAPPPSKPSTPGGLTMSDITTILNRLDRLERLGARKAIAVRDPRDKKVWVVCPDGTRRHLPNPGNRAVDLLVFLGVLQPGGDGHVHPISAAHLDLIPTA